MVLMTGAVGADETTPHWELDLSRSELGPSTDFGTGLEVREENGVRFLSKQDTATQFIFSKQTRGRETANWNNFIYRVKFRENEASTLSLVVKSGGTREAVGYMQYYISVGRAGFGLRCHGLAQDAGVDEKDPRRESAVKYEEIGAAPIAPGSWVTAEVTVGEEVIKVSADAGDGVLRQAEFKAFAGSGGVQVLTRSPLDIAAASVRPAAGEVVPSKD